MTSCLVSAPRSSEANEHVCLASDSIHSGCASAFDDMTGVCIRAAIDIPPLLGIESERATLWTRCSVRHGGLYGAPRRRGPRQHARAHRALVDLEG